MRARRPVSELIDLGDLDELLRRVDDLCDDGDWPDLLDLRDRCRAAFARGRQLWPAASHAEYRMALQAPGLWAASVLGGGAGHFSLGPLTEVLASTHTWREVADHLPPGPDAALVAHERVVRGEDLREEAGIDRSVLDLPLRLERWEPAYPLAIYKPYTAEFPDPPPATGAGAEELTVPAGAPAADDPEAVHALVELVSPWTTQSNGTASAVAVEGDAAAAVGAVAGGGVVVMREVDDAEALAVMAWAGASGGAHGRRRGMAHGRFSAWWALAALAGELDRWPHVEDSLGRLRWFLWQPSEPTKGWAVRLAAQSLDGRRAWALEGTDRA